MLNLRQFHGRGAFLVVVDHVVDPRAYRVAPLDLTGEALCQFVLRVGMRHLKKRARTSPVPLSNHNYRTA
jgi:hypothetical protein